MLQCSVDNSAAFIIYHVRPAVVHVRPAVVHVRPAVVHVRPAVVHVDLLVYRLISKFKGKKAGRPANMSAETECHYENVHCHVVYMYMCINYTIRVVILHS